MALLRVLIPNKKKRFNPTGHDLDISYITDRLLVCSFPTEGMFFKNTMLETLRFLETAHKDHYKMYNLCAESKYDPTKFKGRVAEYPVVEGTPPTMDCIYHFINDVNAWLDANPLHVGVVHCSNGKERSGVMVCCWLLQQRKCLSASHALDYFVTVRCRSGVGGLGAVPRGPHNENIMSPSLRRYISYYERYLSDKEHKKQYSPNNMRVSIMHSAGLGGPSADRGVRDSFLADASPFTERPLLLERISIFNLPNFGLLRSVAPSPCFSITRRDKTVYTFKNMQVGKPRRDGNQSMDFDCNHTHLQGDIIITFFDRKFTSPLFRLSMHTGFVKADSTGHGTLALARRDIDRAYVDPRFPQDFKVLLHFGPPANTSETPKLSMEDVLGDPKLCRAFRRYLAYAQCQENLDFVVQVAKFKSLFPGDAANRQARDIYDKFIQHGAPSEININSHVANNILNNINTPVKTMFAEAESEALTLLRTDSFPKFVASAYYTGMFEPEPSLPVLDPIERERKLIKVQFNSGNLIQHATDVIGRMSIRRQTDAPRPTGLDVPISAPRMISSSRNLKEPAQVLTPNPNRVGSPRTGPQKPLPLTPPTKSSPSFSSSPAMTLSSSPSESVRLSIKTSSVSSPVLTTPPPSRDPAPMPSTSTKTPIFDQTDSSLEITKIPLLHNRSLSGSHLTKGLAVQRELLCGGCRKPIGVKDVAISCNFAHYHWACMTCSKCRQPLSGSACIFKEDGLPQCERCEAGSESFFPPCRVCSQSVVDANASKWKSLDGAEEYFCHHACMVCSVCKVPLQIFADSSLNDVTGSSSLSGTMPHYCVADKKLYCRTHHPSPPPNPSPPNLVPGPGSSPMTGTLSLASASSLSSSVSSSSESEEEVTEEDEVLLKDMNLKKLPQPQIGSRETVSLPDPPAPPVPPTPAPQTPSALSSPPRTPPTATPSFTASPLSSPLLKSKSSDHPAPFTSLSLALPTSSPSGIPHPPTTPKPIKALSPSSSAGHIPNSLAINTTVTTTVSKAGKPSTLPHTTCFKCNVPIVEDGERLEASGRTYHPKCFRCITCHTLLFGRYHISPVNGQIYCERHVPDNKPLPPCKKCSKPLTQFIRVRESVFCDDCFDCYGCHKKFGANLQYFHVTQDKYLCPSCYQRLLALRSAAATSRAHASSQAK
eukprot:TRINITY_DN4352_c0_g1_i2.p1 TRINITY_DN4352_c0_g1~~TRINITY_DN4352_c0_g1_i2.p1  ORF type:complete len:1178 (+),score=171.65 TRINITY_DN4352_c0_g1_i2:40-3534(+)